MATLLRNRTDTCVQCGVTFTHQARYMRVCGPECKRQRDILRKRAERREKGVARRAKPTTPEYQVRACDQCGKLHPRPNGTLYPRAYCSHPCYIESRRKYSSPQERWSVGHVKRRLRKRTALVETFPPLEIFERDGWRCHICKCLTLPAKRGTNHAKAPVIDHIVPLARGGEHSRVNVACACWKCNASKGSRDMGQLRLFG